MYIIIMTQLPQAEGKTSSAHFGQCIIDYKA